MENENPNDEPQEETVDEEPKSKGLTPEQQAKIDAISITVAKFNKMVPPFLFNQLQMIDEGEIRMVLVIKDKDIEKMLLTTSLARDFTRIPVKEPGDAKED